MARAQATAAKTTAPAPVRRSTRNLAKEDSALRVKKEEDENGNTPNKASPSKSRALKRDEPTTPSCSSSSGRKPKRIRAEATTPSSLETTPADTSPSKADVLQARKLASYTQTAGGISPFPNFPRPTAEDCALAHDILTSLHGARSRAPASEKVVAPVDSAGCGTSPSVLDALIRTILSQNTSDANSSRAKLAMDAEYGGGGGDTQTYYSSIALGGVGRLERTIRAGGLAGVKSRVIMAILEQTREKYGSYSLDHLFAATDDEAMRELLAMKGVGPKTASCVLLFCLRRESFAVDTHVYRITGLLGWRPTEDGGRCGREEAQAHLDARVPDGLKYGLHVLLVGHGKVCEECRAGGKSVERCELRKAFRGRKGGVKGEEVKEVKEEVKESDGIKKEDDDES